MASCRVGNKVVRVRPSLIEQLEGRSLFSSGVVYRSYDPPSGQSSGAQGDLVPGASGDSNIFGHSAISSATLNVTNLPTHSMARITYDWQTNDVDDEGFTISSDGVSATYENDGVGNQSLEESGFGHWIANSSSSLSFSVQAHGYIDVLWVQIEVYNPSVSISGGGTVSEGSGTPLTYTVSRDLPAGYLGTSYGDEAIPDTVANLTVGGTATQGSDYTGTLPTTTTLSGSSSNVFSITPIWDDIADEPNETATLAVGSPGVSLYGPADAPNNEANGTIQNTNKTYAISVNTSRLLIHRGIAFNTTATVTLNNNNVSNQDVVKIDGPAGLDVTFARDPSNAENIIVTITASGSTPLGQQTLTVGLSSDHSVTAQILLSVTT